MIGNSLTSAAAAVLGMAALITSTRADSAGCGKPPSLYTGTHSLTVNGTERTYILQLPDGYDANTPHKLYFGFHWLHGTQEAVYANSWYGLQPLANGTATIFVAPQGIDNGWANPNGTDVSLFDAILATLSETLCIDDRHVYSIGFSYGAAFTHALACARPNVLRAAAVLSAAELSGCDGGTEPVAFLGQHGVNDTVLPIARGREVRDRWVRNNGCELPSEEPPAPEPLSLQWNETVYAACLPDKPVWWIAHGGGHWALPDGGAGGLSFAPARFWEFFSQFQ
ncbi:hypothetical protein MPH_13220 [Macrophomina phaseolina MS6]|uniref:Feruloyl esterase C n=1 Tax=Macrophomina phaseolina (strain MS6) TaxID=1126212 RepID=K2R695_MACPH|nr:hypothetical protein MPH_13220 [Macrophomina phaseolina MS6]